MTTVSTVSLVTVPAVGFVSNGTSSGGLLATAGYPGGMYHRNGGADALAAQDDGASSVFMRGIYPDDCATLGIFEPVAAMPFGAVVGDVTAHVRFRSFDAPDLSELEIQSLFGSGPATATAGGGWTQQDVTFYAPASPPPPGASWPSYMDPGEMFRLGASASILVSTGDATGDGGWIEIDRIWLDVSWDAAPDGDTRVLAYVAPNALDRFGAVTAPSLRLRQGGTPNGLRLRQNGAL